MKLLCIFLSTTTIQRPIVEILTAIEIRNAKCRPRRQVSHLFVTIGQDVVHMLKQANRTDEAQNWIFREPEQDLTRLALQR